MVTVQLLMSRNDQISRGYAIARTAVPSSAGPSSLAAATLPANPRRAERYWDPARSRALVARGGLAAEGVSAGKSLGDSALLAIGGLERGGSGAVSTRQTSLSTGSTAREHGLRPLYHH